MLDTRYYEGYEGEGEVKKYGVKKTAMRMV